MGSMVGLMATSRGLTPRGTFQDCRCQCSVPVTSQWRPPSTRGPPALADSYPQHQPWDKFPMAISSSDVGRTSQEWTQWWLLGRAVLVFPAACQSWGHWQEVKIKTVSLCISKENREKQSWRDLLQIFKK